MHFHHEPSQMQNEQSYQFDESERDNFEEQLSNLRLNQFEGKFKIEKNDEKFIKASQIQVSSFKCVNDHEIPTIKGSDRKNQQDLNMMSDSQSRINMEESYYQNSRVESDAS